MEFLFIGDFYLLQTELSGWSAVRDLVASGWLSAVPLQTEAEQPEFNEDIYW